MNDRTPETASPDDARPHVDVRDPRQPRLDALNEQPFNALGPSPSNIPEVKPKNPSDAELVALAHAQYVMIPGEDHQERLLRVVKVIRRALSGGQWRVDV